MYEASSRSQISVLEAIGPAMDPTTAERAGDLLNHGAMGGWLSITTDDAPSAHDTLVERAVNGNDELAEKSYLFDREEG